MTEKVKKNVSIHRGLDSNGYNAYKGITASGKPDKSAILSKCQEVGNPLWQDRLSQTAKGVQETCRCGTSGHVLAGMVVMG